MFQCELELAIDRDSSESDSVCFCAAHYTAHVQTRLAACSLSGEAKPDDVLRDGELMIRVWDLEQDTDIGEWRLCSEHAMALWNLKGEP